MIRKFLIPILLSIQGIVNAQDSTRLSMIFVGDIMQHDSQILAAYQAKSQAYSYRDCFKYVSPLIASADLAFGNLELTLAGPPYKGYPQFSAPDALTMELKRSGFDVLVTANNHSLDRRKRGLERTIDVLDSIDILHTGTFKDSLHKAAAYPLLIAKNGFRISLLNYTYGTNGIPVTSPNIVNLLDTVEIRRDLMKAKEQKPDAIIAFVHWGVEYQDAPSQQQKRVSKFLFDNDVKLIIGSHPHVIQPMSWDLQRDHLVAYSLGNFVSGQQSRYRDGGAMLYVELTKVVQPDSTIVTRINDARFDLEWVYRNNERPKKYFILPMKEFENDTLILDEGARLRMKEFTTDSRKLLVKNENVQETDRAPMEISYLDIHLSDQQITMNDSLSVLKFYGTGVEQDSDSVQHWVTHRFYDREIAEKALDDIQSKTEFKDAFIVWHYWDRLIRLSSRKDDTD